MLICLFFLQPENGAANVDTVSVSSGEKLLRTVMNDEKLELYNLYVSKIIVFVFNLFHLSS